mgnify:CR=1 FL=1
MRQWHSNISERALKQYLHFTDEFSFESQLPVLPTLMKLTITYSVNCIVTDLDGKNNQRKNIFIFIILFGANVKKGLKNPPLFTFFSFQDHKIHDIIGGN